MAEKRLTNRQLQAINTRKKIYQRAVSLMEQRGFHNITVADICKAAGVSIGSFYNHFSSKHDVLNEVFQQADDFFRETVAGSHRELPAPERIVAFFRYYALYNEERGIDFVKQLYHINNNLFTMPGRQMQAVLKEIIEAGQTKKELTCQVSSEELVEYLFIAARGIVYHWCLKDGGFDLVAYTTFYMEQMIKSVVMEA